VTKLKRDDRGLTPVMAEVLALHESGLSIVEIAKQRGTKYGTAYVQLTGAKRIADKINGGKNGNR